MTTLRLIVALAFVAVAAPALARPAPTTRLVSCGEGDCLLVRGRRASADASVRINGREVRAQGARSWRVRLPVATVRAWSAPMARDLAVAVAAPGGSIGPDQAARLPVGLLGHDIELASLIVRAR